MYKKCNIGNVAKVLGIYHTKIKWNEYKMNFQKIKQQKPKFGIELSDITKFLSKDFFGHRQNECMDL